MSLDNRAKIYEDLASREIRNEQPKVAQTNCKCSDYMIEMKI